MHYRISDDSEINCGADEPWTHDINKVTCAECLKIELLEGDHWKERVEEAKSNGTCPWCFCTDEGPHEKGCHIGELEILLRIAEKIGQETLGTLWQDRYMKEIINAR